MKYSPTTGVFYPDSVTYPELPGDLIETTDELFIAWCAAAPGSTITVGEGGALTIEPPPALTLEQAKAEQIALLNSGFYAATTAPVSFTNAAGATASFPETDQAKTYLGQCIAAGADAWKLNLWLDVNGAPVSPFTFADLQGLAAAMAGVEAPQYQDLLTKIATVEAATTVAAVQAVSWS